MTTVEVPPVADDSTPRKVGRPRLGTGAQGSREASKQDSIYFGPGQIDRMKVLAERLVTSRNRLVARAVRELLAQHGRKRKPPIPLVPSGGMKLMRQWIPESAEQLDKLRKLADTWGVDKADALRIAVELLLLSQDIPPAPPAEEAKDDA